MKLGATRLSVLLVVLLATSACHREDPQAVAAAQAAAQEQAAVEAAKAFDNEVAQQNWEMAKAHADVLLAEYPQTKTAARVQQSYDEINSKAEAARDSRRLTNLWSYDQIAVKGGTQRSAAIYAKEPVDTDGSGARSVRLVFRDHPSWKRSSYLILQTGDFDCYGGCKVQVSADGVAKSMAASRPKTDEAIAMFIEDERALWRLVRKSKVVEIEFPVKAGGKRSAQFEVSGLNGEQLPGWD